MSKIERIDIKKLFVSSERARYFLEPLEPNGLHLIIGTKFFEGPHMEAIALGQSKLNTVSNSPISIVAGNSLQRTQFWVGNNFETMSETQQRLGIRVMLFRASNWSLDQVEFLFAKTNGLKNNRLVLKLTDGYLDHFNSVGLDEKHKLLRDF